jgi:MFS family permease
VTQTAQRDAAMWTGRFVLLFVAGAFYFTAMGTVLPVLPTFISDDLGGGDLAIGIALGGMGWTAAALRPFVGALGDARGRRILSAGGSVIVAVSIAGNLVATSVPVVIAFRLLTGVGEAAVFVGLAAAIQDIAPPHRRGEATSLYSVTIYGGLAAGPLIGEWLDDTFSSDTVWTVGGILAVAAALFSLAAPGGESGTGGSIWPTRLYHPAAYRPGLIVFVALFGWAGFLAFVTVWAEEVGIARAGTVFALFAGIVLVLRIFAARVPDALGPIRTTRFALLFTTLGLGVIGAWHSVPGIYVGTALLGLGQTFLFPALFVLVIDTAPDAERSQAVASFSISFDLAVAAGGAAAGAIVALTGATSSAFLLGAGLNAVALAFGPRSLRGLAEERGTVGDLTGSGARPAM